MKGSSWLMFVADWKASQVPGHSPQDGFSLIEMLAVLTIFAVAGSILIPSFSQPPDALIFETGSRELTTGLRAARSEAIATNRDTLVTIDINKRIARMPGGREVRFPISVSVKVVAARQERFGADMVGFRFFPDGTSTGGEVILTLGKQEAIVEVTWIAGAVSHRRDVNGGK